MGNLKSSIKNMRVEYKILCFFLIIILLSIPYTIIKKHLNSSGVFSGTSSNNYNSSTYMQRNNSLSSMQQNMQTDSNSQQNNQKASSISDAVKADRPLILNDNALYGDNFNQMMAEMPEIKYIDIATQVENPTVWIYSLNDGLRKDDVAEKYCQILHSKGVVASQVTIYDEKERRKGRLIELGTAKCM